MKDDEMAVVREENNRLREQLEQMVATEIHLHIILIAGCSNQQILKGYIISLQKTSTDQNMSYLESKLTTSEDLVAEFQRTLLQKNKELEELAVSTFSCCFILCSALQ